MKIAAALLALALPACMFSTPPPPIQTASGRPECMVPNAEPAAVLDYCASLLAADGWAPHARTASELTMRREFADGALDFYLTKEVWIVATARDGGTHVAGHRVSISRPGTPHESRFDHGDGGGNYALWDEYLRHVPEHFAATATASK